MLQLNKSPKYKLTLHAFSRFIKKREISILKSSSLHHFHPSSFPLPLPLSQFTQLSHRPRRAAITSYGFNHTLKASTCTYTLN